MQPIIMEAVIHKYISGLDLSMPKQRRRKVIKQFLRINLSEKLTTTDNSALEELRCLSTGGAKKTQ